MTKRIVLTAHARSEARRRGIREAIVYEVATASEQRVRVRGSREIRQSRIIDQTSGKLQLIRLVVEVGEADTIVTVYRTSKVRKYWREE